MKPAGFSNKIPVLSSTNNAYIAVYGEEVWKQVTQETNLLGMIPKKPMGKPEKYIVVEGVEL